MKISWSSSTKQSEKFFAAIYEKYWKDLLAISFHHTKNKELAEEIVQDVFISLWQRKGEVDVDSIPNYLATAVKFATFRTLRRLRRQQVIVEGLEVSSKVSMDEQVIDARFLKEYLDGLVEVLPDV